MNIVLWNTSKKPIETQFDGRFFMWAPDERKMFSVNTSWDETLIQHLNFKLDEYGLVQLPEKVSAEEETKAKNAGLKMRLKTMKRVVLAFLTMNKSRASKNLSPELPGETEIACQHEAEEIEQELRKINKNDLESFEKFSKTLGVGEEEGVKKFEVEINSDNAVKTQAKKNKEM